MRFIEAKAAVERAAGLPIELLDAGELRKRAPYVAATLVGGALCPIEGKANPLVAAPAFAAAAEKHGAIILRGQRVIGMRRNGSQFEVRTEDRTHSAARVVNAAAIDIQAFPIQLSVTEPAEPLIKHLLYSARDRLTMKQTRNGSILIGGGWPATMDAQGRPQVSAQSLSRNLAVALEVVPAIAPINIVRTWAAIVNGTESWRPLLGEMPGVPGFFLNYVPWMGFTGGPAGGRIIASLVQGKPAPVEFDLSPFRP
jgi:sarcosine oxidase subunit beta